MFGSKQAYEADGMAKFTLPDGWHPRPGERQGVWSAFEFSKSQSWHFGAGDPKEVHGFAIAVAAEATPEDLESAMDWAFREIQADSRRFDEFGNMKTGSRTTWMSEGSYQISPGHDPEKVLFLRSIDPEKQTALVMRVYLRKYKHEKARQIEHEFFHSFQYLEGRAKHFATSPRPGLVAVNRFLRSRGLPLATGETPIAQDGWVYYLAGDNFVIGRRLDARPADLTGVGWLTFRDGKWQQGGERVPDRWARRIGLDGDRSRSYYFHVLTCDVTANDCALPAWFARVAAASAATSR